MKPVKITDLMTYAGTGPKTTRRLVREGYLPGHMDGKRYVCSPGEFAKWMSGDWTPTPRPQQLKSDTVKPMLVTRTKSAA